MDFVILLELIIMWMAINLRMDWALQQNPNQSIVCEEGDVFVQASNQCLEGRKVREDCHYSEQCQYFDTNTYCNDSWLCAFRCQTGHEFNPMTDKCVKKLNYAIKSKLRDVLMGLRYRNKSALNKLNQMFLVNGSRKINLFSFLDKPSTSRYGVCSSDHRWNNNTNICEGHPILLYSGSLLMTLMFSVAFISLILMVYRRRTNQTLHLFQTLNSFNLANNSALGSNVYFVAIPSNDNTLPTYQECMEPDQNNSKLPSYDEAIAANQ